MRITGLAVLLIASAAWLLMQPGGRRLARISRRKHPNDQRQTKLEHLGRMLLVGRDHAPPVRIRAQLATLLALLAPLVSPGLPGLVTGLIAWPFCVIAAGWLWPEKKKSPMAGAKIATLLELLAACLEAGLPMHSAVQRLVSVADEATASRLRAVESQLALGSTDSDAWLALGTDHWWGPIARDIARSANSGTSLVGTLEVHAMEQRRITGAERRRQARAVGVRSVVPLVLCFLPAFLLVGIVPVIAGLLKDLFG